MKPNLIANSAALAAAIHYEFGGSAACHCHGHGKLSEAEVLDGLCQRGFIHHADAGKQALDVNVVLSEVRGYTIRQDLRKRGVKYLPQLQDWTFADLLALPGVVVGDARRVEFIMSRYGIALKDGDPSRYRHLFEQEKKQEPDGRPSARTPDEETRATDTNCHGCIVGKSERDPFPIGNEASVRGVVCADTVGPTAVAQVGGCGYVVTFRDLERRYSIAFRQSRKFARGPPR